MPAVQNEIRGLVRTMALATPASLSVRGGFRFSLCTTGDVAILDRLLSSLGAGLVGGQTTAMAAPIPPFWPAMAIGVVLIFIGTAIIAAPLITVFIYWRKASVLPNPTPADSNDED